MSGVCPRIPKTRVISRQSKLPQSAVIGFDHHSAARSTSLTGGGDFVPQEKVSMRKIKEVLRLRFGLGLQQNQIARSCSIHPATVHRYLEKAAAAGLSWPLPGDVDDHRLEELLFPVASGRPSKPIRSLQDFA